MEIGVGTGRFAVALGIPVGVEPAPGMAEVARSRGVKVHDAFAESLPFEDEGFDFAVMVTVLCFLDDAARAFREARRVIRPGGALVLAFIDRDSEVGRICEAKKGQSAFYRGATFYSVHDVASLLHDAGFENLSYRQTLFPGESPCQKPREGFGAGSFIVVRGHKKEECRP